MAIKKYSNFKKSEKWVKNIKEYKRLLLLEKYALETYCTTSG